MIAFVAVHRRSVSCPTRRCTPRTAPHDRARRLPTCGASPGSLPPRRVVGRHAVTVVKAEGIMGHPPERVFDFVATRHVENHPQWDPDLAGMRQTCPGPVDPGTTPHVVRRQGRRRVEGTATVTEYRPCRRAAWDVHFGPSPSVRQSTWHASRMAPLLACGWSSRIAPRARSTPSCRCFAAGFSWSGWVDAAARSLGSRLPSGPGPAVEATGRRAAPPPASVGHMRGISPFSTRSRATSRTLTLLC